MEDEKKEKHFNPKAHILTLLGEELIKSPVLAIYELIKNSYDADSTLVDVYFRDIDDKEKAAIIVEDNGIGMSDYIIENVWLEPGTDFRKPYDKNGIERTIIKSPVYKRTPMGEKGIGRFAVHKLSNKILIITRPMEITLDPVTKEIINTRILDYEIELFINWKDFNQTKYLTDIPINWKIRRDVDKFRFKDRSGTYIHMSSLKEAWTKSMARQLKINVLSMTSPKIESGKFKIILNFFNNWLDGLPDLEQIINLAPYKFTAIVDENFNVGIEYVFYPQNQSEIGKREINTLENIRGRIEKRVKDKLESENFDEKIIEETLNFINIGQSGIGEFLFEIFSFDLDPRSLKDTTTNFPVLKTVLKDCSGIKVFKNDLRVYNYGEPGDDWLGLDLKRVNSPGEKISNNQNIGYVILNSESSTKLIEKTNREGFIDNAAYKLFVIIVEELVNLFQAERFKDRANWINFNRTEKKDSLENQIQRIAESVRNAPIPDSKMKEEIVRNIESAGKKYEEQKAALLVPAGVGLTASVAIHEIEKLVPRIHENVNKSPIDIKIVRENVSELEQYVSGMLSILQKGRSKAIDVIESINKAVQNYKYKLEKRKIVCDIDVPPEISSINCEKRYFITMLMNLLDNSIYWLDTIYKSEKKILIKAIIQNNKKIIVIADNGPGFKDDISDVVRPFFTRKEGGMGIGMYLIDTIMLNYGKVDIVLDTQKTKEYAIPDVYTGAIVELVFWKNQEN